MPKSRIALSMKISRKAVWKIEQKYKKWGKEGLKDSRPGRLFEPLSHKFYELVLFLWLQ